MTVCVRPPSLTALLLLLLLTGCAAPGHAPPTASAPGAITDASYDWHVLVLVPFGSLLKDSPLPLHEVLLFHDATNREENDNQDCYSAEGPPPRFLGERPEHQLLCFDHDRMRRIEAAVRLGADAQQVFARACALWLKNTAATMTSATTCEGRDGNVAFKARLDRAPGDVAATVSMTLADDSSTAAHDVPGA